MQEKVSKEKCKLNKISTKGKPKENIKRIRADKKYLEMKTYSQKLKLAIKLIEQIELVSSSESKSIEDYELILIYLNELETITKSMQEDVKLMIQIG